MIACNIATISYSNAIFTHYLCILNETVVESNSAATCGARICKHCSANFDITQWDMDFYNKISPTFHIPPDLGAPWGYKEGGMSEASDGRFVAQIPTPTLCPDCRQRRRLSFRNERKLYRRICDATQQPIISIYSPDKPYKIYNQKTRWSDARDPMDYGMDFDFDKSFTENFRELILVIPRYSLWIYDSENCWYANEIINCRDCYLIFSWVEDRSCLYSNYIDYCSSCIDCDQSINSEQCYNCFAIDWCFKSYQSSHLKKCNNMIDCHFCIWCNHCYDCYGLKNKSYCIANIEYSKEDYEIHIRSYSWPKLSYENINLSEEELAIIVNSENSWGSYLTNCKNVIYSSNIQNSEDCKYCLRWAWMKDCYDCFINGVVHNIKYIECMTVWPWSSNAFTSNSRPTVNSLLYCDLCSNSSNLFGCIWLRNKQYCIFNRQYTKEEYNILVPKIIQHMMITGERGEFFHPSLSPFGYNETVAQEYYPLPNDLVIERNEMWSEANPLGQWSDEVIQLIENNTDMDRHARTSLAMTIDYGSFGYHRSTYEAPTPQSDKVINWQDLPEMIAQVEDSILQYAIRCEITGKLFRIQPQELAFYRKHNIPVPRKHPDQRHLERLALRQ